MKRIGLALLGMLAGILPAKAEGLSPETARLLEDASLQAASVGISVVDLENGREVLGVNSGLSCTPASVLKLFTTAAALEALGPGFRFETRLEYDGAIDGTGTLHGNLYVTGSGDPTLDSDHLSGGIRFPDECLKALRDRGVRRVTGRIVADASCLGPEGVPPGWLWEDLGNYFAAGCYGLNYRDNSYRITFSTGAPGSMPRITAIDPAVDSLQLENRLRAAPNDRDSAYVYGAPFSYRRTLYGTVPANRAAFSIKGDLPNPPLFLAGELEKALREAGIGTGEAPTAVFDPISGAERQLLSSHRSEPLSRIAAVTNRYSNNLYAEALFRAPGGSASLPAAREALRKQLATLGVPERGLFLHDGCGLSPLNRVTARSVTALLNAMYRSKNREAWLATLPVAGQEGTVRNLLKGTALEGRARLKSGSMAQVQCYAGYLLKGKKPRYAVALLINQYEGPAGAIRSLISKLLLAIDRSLE